MLPVKNIVKRKGRPSLTKGKQSVFVGVKLPEETVRSVDRWGKQKGINRSQALRELIEQALAKPKPK